MKKHNSDCTLYQIIEGQNIWWGPCSCEDSYDGTIQWSKIDDPEKWEVNEDMENNVWPLFI